MTEFPILETERFNLRQIIQSDSNDLFHWMMLRGFMM